MSQKLLIATTNPAKAKEYLDLLSDLSIEIVSLADLKEFRAVEENGDSFEENAITKAKGYFSQFHLPVIADDGGLMIDALNGEPGVKSHRWPGYPASDQQLINYALEKLKNVPLEKRTAKLVTTITFYDGINLLAENGGLNGYIVEETPKEIKNNGFPWRAILFLPDLGKVYQDLTEEEQRKINHRKKILEKLKPKIKKILGAN